MPSRSSTASLTHRPGPPGDVADATVNMQRSALNEVVAGSATIEALVSSGRLAVEGDQAKLGELLGPPDPGFAIVTP
jgi:alkyl sulfatase BDS1-like metallo-beta-lactamase superfamily hydrolase